jgi:hypothetical protein
MHVMLSSRRGYSQILFLGILSRHVYSTRRGSSVGGLEHKAKVVAPRLHRRKSDGNMNRLKIFLIFGMCKRRFSEH